ncbi:MFS transporter, partial [Citrobacter koseri]|uniref:MFS transporter n=1 Tax=Citrobacter koseri TaxID=545 RepID=UPI0013D55072
KYTFLITIVMMGGSTALIGFLPSYASVGHAAWISLLVLRLVQGLAVGGEYGGAVIYVAEHSRADRRGLLTGWIQIT